MTLKDVRGNALSGANETSAELYGKTLRQLNLYQGDPVATVDAAIAESPDFVMAHAMRAWLHLLGTEPGGLPVARGRWMQRSICRQRCRSGGTSPPSHSLRTVAGTPRRARWRM